MPKAVARRIRALSGSDPVYVTKNKSVCTSAGISDTVFCKACEDRLNRGGEQWMMSHCLREDKSFPLQETLSHARPDGQLRNAVVYHAAGLPSIDVPKIGYFAASVFWRGSVHTWRHGKHALKQVSLDSNEDEFRRYLLGQGVFPVDAALLVCVSPLQEPIPTCDYPYGGVEHGYRHYAFSIPGVFVDLFLGAFVPTGMHGMSIVRAFGNPIHVSRDIEYQSLVRRRRSMGKSTPVGKLRKLL
jgi:hypothetical protein